jgi:hypothetical protein
MIEAKRWFPGFRKCTKEPATVASHRGYVNQGVCVVCNPDVPWWQKQATAEGNPEGRWQKKAGGNPEGRWQTSSSSSSGYKRKEQPDWSQQAWKKHQPPHDAHADATQAAAPDVVVVDADVVVPAKAQDDGMQLMGDKSTDGQGTDGQPSEAIAEGEQDDWDDAAWAEWEKWDGEEEEDPEADMEEGEEEEVTDAEDDEDAEWARLNAKIGKMKGVVIGQFLHGGAHKQRKRMRRSFRANLHMLMVMCSKLGRCHRTQ